MLLLENSGQTADSGTRISKITIYFKLTSEGCVLSKADTLM